MNADLFVAHPLLERGQGRHLPKRSYTAGWIASPGANDDLHSARHTAAALD